VIRTISHWFAVSILALLSVPASGQQPVPETIPHQAFPVVDLRDRTLQSITLDIEPRAEKLPDDLSSEIIHETEMLPPPVVEYFYWEAPELWHHPLYFDDVQLERYGQSIAPRWQPFFSGAHFFGTLPILPYKMGHQSPRDCVTNLGYYRPGSPTPCVGRRLPWSRRGAWTEAGTWVGLVFLLP
jgi:hypothetical protein